ncbi:hypothetical protein PybrP1_011384 [[Pythium] brassicae (nom. inval.)]|nr:hypothetical protein PybrP1_011384 [[Pythium] brassicae (nom. inval.)]
MTCRTPRALLLLLLAAGAAAAVLLSPAALADRLLLPLDEVCAGVREISAFGAAHCAGDSPPAACAESFAEYARDADVFKRCEAAGLGGGAALTRFKTLYATWQQQRVCDDFHKRERQAARECAGDNVHRPWNAASWPLFCHQTFRSYEENRRELDALCGRSESSPAFFEGFADYVASPTCKAYYDAVRGAARRGCDERSDSDECARLFRWYRDKQREVETDCLELHNAKPFYKGFYRWKKRRAG